MTDEEINKIAENVIRRQKEESYKSMIEREKIMLMLCAIGAIPFIILIIILCLLGIIK